MTETARYRRGLWLSLCFHLLVAGIAYWTWKRPPQKPKQEPSVWEVNLFEQKPLTTPVPPPPVETEPQAPEVTALPPDTLPEVLPSASPPAGRPGPTFDMPNLTLPTGPGGAGYVGVPTPGPAQWNWMGTGSGGAAPGTGSGGTASGRTLLSSGPMNSLPTAIVRIPPAYPMEARRKKLEGWVRIEFTVHTDGTVTDIKVRDAKPSGIFDQAAIDAIQQWKFRPAVENGKPIRKRAAQTLKFELDQS